MKIGLILGQLSALESGLAATYRESGERHADDHDVYHQCVSFAKKAESHVAKLASSMERYAAQGDAGSEVQARDSKELGLLAMLRTLFLAAEEVSITWVMAGQAAQAARDADLLAVVHECHAEVELQVKWLTTRIKVAAPQALVTA
jgi:hypothetical protein